MVKFALNNKHRGFVNIILVAIAVVVIAVTGYFVAVNKSGVTIKQLMPISTSTSDISESAPMPKSKSDTIKIKLLNAFSGQIIPHADVKIYSDNGIRCFTTPCNTERQEWTDKSDDNGFIFVPSKLFNVQTSITATGYRSGRDLNKDSEKIANNNWLIELDPDNKIDNFERRLKFIDLQTQKPISNVSLWIINNQNCQPPACSDYSFKGTTNALGNVYYPTSTVNDNSWIFVNGYKAIKFPTGWVNYKVILEKSTESYRSGASLLALLNQKAHELLCAENNLGFAEHEMAALGYGYEGYQTIYQKTDKEFIDLQAQYRLQTGNTYNKPQLKSPPNNCPDI